MYNVSLFVVVLATFMMISLIAILTFSLIHSLITSVDMDMTEVQLSYRPQCITVWDALKYRSPLLPVKFLSTAENSSTFAICLDEPRDPDTAVIKRLPCLHEFNTVCIDRWMPRPLLGM